MLFDVRVYIDTSFGKDSHQHVYEHFNVFTCFLMIHLVQPQVNFTSGRHVWDISSDWKGIILNIKLFEGGALYPEWAFLVCIINFWVAEYLLYVIRKSILIKFVCVVNSFLKVHLL